MKPVPKILSILGGILFIPIVLVSGAAIGGLLYLISKAIYLIFIFPFLAGLAGAVILNSLITRTGIHFRILGTLAGLLMGLAIYGSYHAASYLDARAEGEAAIRAELKEEFGRADPALAAELLDTYLLEETGHSGFPGFMILKSRAGVSFQGYTVYGMPTPSLTTGPALTWLYWLVESAIVLLLTLITGFTASSPPFCAYHNAWYAARKHLGGVPKEKTDMLFLLIRNGDFYNLGKTLQDDAAIPSMEIFTQGCDNCTESKPLFIVEEVTSLSPTTRNQVRLKKSIELARYSDLLRGLNARPKPDEQHSTGA